MGFDRSDFEKHRGEKPARPGSRPLLHQLIAAAPSMETLTRSNEWNRFLGYVQGRIEHAEREAADAKRTICDPRVVAHEPLIAAKVRLAHAQGRIDALQEVAAIPKQILESGVAAGELLAKLQAAKNDA